MSLRHALLALLDARAMTGYSLTKHFDQSVAYVWHAPHSQIYPELRRMEAEGLVAGQVETRGERGTRRVYAITDGGRAELERWVNEPTTLQRERDAAYLKAKYYEFGSFDNARRHYQAHLIHHEQQLRLWEAQVVQLENREDPTLQLRLNRASAEEYEAIVAYKVHVYRGLVERARNEVEWARQGLALVDKLEAQAARTSAAREAER